MNAAESIEVRLVAGSNVTALDVDVLASLFIQAYADIMVMSLRSYDPSRMDWQGDDIPDDREYIATRLSSGHSIQMKGRVSAGAFDAIMGFCQNHDIPYDHSCDTSVDAGVEGCVEYYRPEEGKTIWFPSKIDGELLVSREDVIRGLNENRGDPEKLEAYLSSLLSVSLKGLRDYPAIDPAAVVSDLAKSSSGTKQLTAVVDFDGVISDYKEWRGVDVLDPPLPLAEPCLSWLKARGWLISVWTVRLVTPTLIGYLHTHCIPYHSINSSTHNVPHTSREKPQADVYLDDHDIVWDFCGGFSWALAFMMIVCKYHWDVRDEAVEFLMTNVQRLGLDVKLVDVALHALESVGADVKLLLGKDPRKDG